MELRTGLSSALPVFLQNLFSTVSASQQLWEAKYLSLRWLCRFMFSALAFSLGCRVWDRGSPTELYVEYFGAEV